MWFSQLFQYFLGKPSNLAIILLPIIHVHVQNIVTQADKAYLVYVGESFYAYHMSQPDRSSAAAAKVQNPRIYIKAGLGRQQTPHSNRQTALMPNCIQHIPQITTRCTQLAKRTKFLCCYLRVIYKSIN